jgi:hypothetical protein
VRNAKDKLDGKPGGAVRFGPLGTAWDRLGPDKIFSSAFARMLRRDRPRAKGSEWVSGWVGECERRVMSTQVVDISSKMVKSCVARGLISRQLRRKPHVFGAFLTRNPLDFSRVTEILPDFYWGARRETNPAFCLKPPGAERQARAIYFGLRNADWGIG